MAKEKRATWWKMFSHQRAAIESVSDADAGSGLKAAFRYFDGEGVDSSILTSAAFTVFCVIRPYIDESKRDYEESVKNGRSGGNKRWGNTDSPPIPPLSPPIGASTEVEAEADADADAEEAEVKRAATPPRAPRPFEDAPELQDAFDRWLAYKGERHESYKPQGRRALISRIRAKATQYGADAVVAVIEESMSSGYKGLVLDRLDKRDRRTAKSVSYVYSYGSDEGSL